MQEKINLVKLESDVQLQLMKTPMQEKTLEEEIDELMRNYDLDEDEETEKVFKSKLLSFISSREDKAREEGRKEVTKIYWSEEKVLDIQHDAITQYKEELLGKMPEVMRPDFTKVTSLTAKRRMTVRANGFNSCLSEVKKLLQL